MGNRSYPKLVDGLESADDDGSVQGANRAISASLTADSIQKEPGKFVERTAWLFVIISCLDGLDSDLLFQLIKFFNYLHTFLDKPEYFLWFSFISFTIRFIFVKKSVLAPWIVMLKIPQPCAFP